MLVHQLIMALLDNYVEPYINNGHIYMTCLLYTSDAADD